MKFGPLFTVAVSLNPRLSFFHDAVKQSHIEIIKSFYDHISGEGKNPITPDDGIDVTRTIDDIGQHLSKNSQRQIGLIN